MRNDRELDAHYEASRALRRLILAEKNGSKLAPAWREEFQRRMSEWRQIRGVNG